MFKENLRHIYFWTWRQFSTGGNISTHIWLHMKLFEASDFGVHFRKKINMEAWVPGRLTSCEDPRRNKKKKNLCSYPPQSYRQTCASSYFPACVTFFLCLTTEPYRSLQHPAFGDFLWLYPIPWRSLESYVRWRDYREPQTFSP